MATYRELNSRPASAFLNASAFHTAFDGGVDRGAEKYRETFELCKGFKAFHIGAYGTWSADCKDGSFMSSYEGIGYHAYTAYLLQAVLDSDCAFFVHRLENGGIVTYDMRAMQADRAGCAA